MYKYVNKDLMQPRPQIDPNQPEKQWEWSSTESSERHIYKRIGANIPRPIPRFAYPLSSHVHNHGGYPYATAAPRFVSSLDTGSPTAYYRVSHPATLVSLSTTPTLIYSYFQPQHLMYLQTAPTHIYTTSRAWPKQTWPLLEIMTS